MLNSTILYCARQVVTAAMTSYNGLSEMSEGNVTLLVWRGRDGGGRAAPGPCLRYTCNNQRFTLNLS